MKERPVLRPRESEIRCAICHGGDDLTACHRCGALTHFECYQELKRCPTLGCVKPPAEPIFEPHSPAEPFFDEHPWGAWLIAAFIFTAMVMRLLTH